MSSSSAAAPATRSGVWDGSDVEEEHNEFLRQTRRLPSADLVRARAAPEGEIRPAPEEGERVIFRSHLMRGLGLPASGFFRSFLEFHSLQLHHLTPNTVVLLAAFATLCEGFLGVLPTIELWGEFFSSKLGTHVAGMPAQCGSFIAMRRSMADNPFPSISLIKSVRMWQRSYFYMKNLASDGDWVNLPAYAAGPPAGRLPSWSHRVKTLTPAGAAAVARLRVLTQSEGLVGADLLAAFVARRVLPLQGRPPRPKSDEHQGDAPQGGGEHGELHCALRVRGGLAVRQGAVLARQPSTSGKSRLPAVLSFFRSRLRLLTLVGFF